MDSFLQKSMNCCKNYTKPTKEKEADPNKKAINWTKKLSIKKQKFGKEKNKWKTRNHVKRKKIIDNNYWLLKNLTENEEENMAITNDGRQGFEREWQNLKVCVRLLDESSIYIFLHKIHSIQESIKIHRFLNPNRQFISHETSKLIKYQQILLPWQNRQDCLNWIPLDYFILKKCFKSFEISIQYTPLACWNILFFNYISMSLCIFTIIILVIYGQISWWQDY